MQPNSVQFAVVREDPEVEGAVMRRISEKADVMLIGSGGCTAFDLLVQFPTASYHLLDPNPHQLELIRRKLQVLQKGCEEERMNAFGIGREFPDSLTASGNFEKLFRSMRGFLHEFVLSAEDWLSLFEDGCPYKQLDRIFSNPYWRVAFELFFSESLLQTMFGPMAIQHAPKGSYPRYFQNVLERGLQDADADTNYFLHHIFLGYYLNDPQSLPRYLSSPLPKAPWNVSFIEDTAQDHDTYRDYDLISFSNIFDWMDADEIKVLADRVAREMKQGAWLIYRQLNNEKDFRPLFGPTLHFEEHFSKQLHRSDRSLFYSHLRIATKQ